MDRGRSLDRTTLVVVGNGMVSHRLCASLCELGGGERFRVVVLGEEPRPAYDRVQLTRYFADPDADRLLLADADWYRERGIELRTSARATTIDREAKRARLQDGSEQSYDLLALCTGSAPFVPPIEGTGKAGVFVYRTIEDLAAIKEACARARSAAVIGGGLLGLEAARAVQEAGLETHVIEVAPRLMPRQLDDSGAALLRERIEALGVRVHLGKAPAALTGHGRVEGLRFSDGSELAADLVVISAGIRPRDELARGCGLAVGERGGVIVDDGLATSDPSIFALGEVALHRGMLYGLVAPGYAMADVLAKRLMGGEERFGGSDLSAKLKLMGVEVASFGEPVGGGAEAKSVVFHDVGRGVYQRLWLSADSTKLLGGILVGETSQYGRLVQLTRSGEAVPARPEELVFGLSASLAAQADKHVCVCNNVTRSQICERIKAQNLCTVADVKSCTKAGTGCGACVPLVTELLQQTLAAAGKAQRPRLCEHFAYTRQELFEVVSVKGHRSFPELLAEYGTGSGCEICKPAVASILASLHNDMVLNHATIQDTNDRFLANMQRGGLYSVVPRVPGGEITPDKLIALGVVAKKYGLYTKITGGQRIDLFGARVHQLPDIWQELIAAGFESGHAYGKAVRTVKSCVGSTWCRFGVQDSVAFAIRVEERYKGVRAPHKLKSAVSGCTRECAEAQSKDFGIIATEKGWNLYVCGNGGMKPRHADLLASDLDDETCLRYIDRFLMFYIRTADRLTRTSVWLEKLEGGLAHLRDVVVNDSLGICQELEAQMQHLIDTYRCEWAEVVKDPARRAAFTHFANSEEPDPGVRFLPERGQVRPADWPSPEPVKLHLPLLQRRWVPLARAADVPRDGGVAVKYGRSQLAIFHYAPEDRFYATQNACPHRKDNVLARGLLGDQGGTPKVACPLHKKTFALQSGACLSGEPYSIATFPARVEDGMVLVELPPPEELERALPDAAHLCDAAAE